MALLAGVPFTAGPIRAAAGFLATVFEAAGFFTADLFAVGLFTVGFFTVGFFTVGFFTVGFVAVSFLAAAFLAVGFLAADVLAVAFFTSARRVGAAAFFRAGAGFTAVAAARFGAVTDFFRSGPGFAGRLATLAFATTGAFRATGTLRGAAERFATVVVALRTCAFTAGGAVRLPVTRFTAEGFPVAAFPVAVFPVAAFPVVAFPVVAFPVEGRRAGSFPTAATIVPAAFSGRGDFRAAPRSSGGVAAFFATPATAADTARLRLATFFGVASSGLTGRSFSPLAAGDGSRPAPRTSLPSSLLSPRRLIPTPSFLDMPDCPFGKSSVST